jgi:uncharacterized protein (DUF2147 family)
MRSLITIAAVLVAGQALAQDAGGLWKTQVSDTGSYLHVAVGPCGDDAGKTCGIITEAFNTEAKDLVGKAIIMGMAPDGPSKWDDGKIWAPDDDKTYSANMALEGEVLKVEGCVLFFCRGQDWTRATPAATAAAGRRTAMSDPKCGPWGD